MHGKGETLLTPLHLHGFTVYFTSRKPTVEEYSNCTQFSDTAVDPEWDPHDPPFLDQEYALLKKGGLLRERPEE